MDMIAKKLKNNWGPEAVREECSQLFEARYVKARSNSEGEHVCRSQRFSDIHVLLTGQNL